MESASVVTEMFYSVLTYGAILVVTMREIVAISLTTHLWEGITIANLPL